MSDFLIAIGNKRYSSWSLRPWLVLKHLGVEFEEVLVPLRTPGSDALKRRYCPSGRVPTLHHGKVVVWESLAICEYLAEIFPDRGLWPRDVADRADARAISSEMHSGFRGLRENMPCNVAVSMPEKPRTSATENDIARISSLWEDRLGRHDGKFLYGDFTIADAMYAPIAIRFRAYGVKLPERSQKYAEMMLALPSMVEWIEAGKSETHRIEVYEPPFPPRSVA